MPDDLLHPTLAVIGDVDIPAAIHCNAIGTIQMATQSNQASGGGATGGDLPRRIIALTGEYTGVGDIHVAAAVYRHAGGRDKATPQCGDALGGGAGCRNFLHRSLVGIGDVYVADTVHR